MNEAGAIFQDFVKNILAVPQRLEVPHMSSEAVTAVAAQAGAVFRSEPTRLQIKPPVTVVGDLHGQLFDLYRILATQGLPPVTTYLFLGDLVDRGEYSVPTLMLVYAMKVLFPDHVFLVRGNHEDDDMARRSGLFQEVMVLYHDEAVYRSFLSSFDMIPLAASIGPSILCVHGGFNEEIKSLAQIDAVQRPIQECDRQLVDGLTWSDPSEQVETFAPSMRGRGCVYGVKAFTELQNSTGIKTLIRGHECVAEGVRYSFSRQLITVFSASNYCGFNRNKASALTITEDYQIKEYVFYLSQDIDDGLCVEAVCTKEPQKYSIMRRGSHNRRFQIMRYRTASSMPGVQKSRSNGETVTLHASTMFTPKHPTAQSLQSLPLMPPLKPVCK